MLRSLEVVIDAASWAPNPVPRELLTRAGPRPVNVLAALLYTAIVTRPPTVHGFHLSDYWAWLRYHPAIAATPDLRLRPEWDDVDSHQKTVLSDELGVGFTTQFIAEALDCSEFMDTLFVVNVLDPTKFSLSGGAKRGPRNRRTTLRVIGGRTTSCSNARARRLLAQPCKMQSHVVRLKKET